MKHRVIRKVEVSSLFWKDLNDWRKHPEYAKIRANIGAMVSSVMRGEPGGDISFRGLDAWEGVRHLHVGSKLILFTAYPDDETLRICALKKHDFYGFKRERKSMANNAANVVLRAAFAASQPFPDWGKINWRDPAEILTHPELREISREALDSLYQELAQEGEDFVRLRKATEGMTDRNAARVADAWLDDLLTAEAAVQSVILERARYRHAHTPSELLTTWSGSETSLQGGP